MSERIVIRRASQDDRAAVVDVVRRVVLEFGLAFDAEGADADLFALPASYAASGGTFDVVAVNSTIVGTMGLMPIGDGVVELRKMYLLPAARGRGTGRVLVDRALTWARNAGFSRMELDTASVLVAARKLYKQNGFEPMASATTQTQCDARYGRSL